MDKNEDILMDGIDERIEAFLRGEMSAEEEAAFKQEIRKNPELRNRAMAMTSLIKGIREKEERKEVAAIKSVEKKYKETASFRLEKAASNDIGSNDSKEKDSNSKARSVIGWACSIAAVFALFFGIQIDKRFKVLNDTLSPYYTHYALDEVSRGDLDSATTAHLYDLFNQIQESRSVSDIIKELEPIYNSFDDDYTYNAYTNDIAWNLALAYVKDDQIDKAITILQKLKADNPDTSIYIKADALIKKLQDL